MNYAIPFNGIASGTIAPASFLKGDPSKRNQYLQAGVGDVPLGITPNASKYVPGTPGISSFPYVEAGDPVFGFVNGMIAELTCGTAWTPFAYVAPDDSGFGRPAIPGDYVGAMTFSSAAAGEITRVVPLLGARLSGDRTLAIIANQNLAGFVSGTTIEVNAADLLVTLPASAAAPGATFTILNIAATAALQAGSVGTQVVPGNGTDIIYATGITTPAVNKSYINTAATAKKGDSVTLRSDGAGGWYELSQVGTWTRQA